MKSDTVHSVIRSPKWEIKTKGHRYPTKRWGHTAVLNKSKLWLYGGKTGKLKEPLYELDCQTFQSHIHQLSGFPESRESHSCSLVKDKLFIWGGCRQEKALNDCISITMKDGHCFWGQIAQFPTLKQRQSHATTVLKDKYIFLYGGSNEDDIYDDFWVFDTDLDIWSEIKNITGKMKKRLGCTLTNIGDKIYMFGGQLEDESYENQVYCLSFPNLELNSPQRNIEMKCQKIIPTSSSSPKGRSCHSTVCYSDRYLIIIAGEGQGEDAKGKNTTVLLNDVWSFDTEKLAWELIDIPNSSIFKARSCLSANLFKNKIVVFGGLISMQNFKSSDELLILSFSQSSQKPLDTCNICKLHYRPIEAKQNKNEQIEIRSRSSFDFGLANLYKISRMIKNPFDAICLLVEGYQKMKYRNLSIDLMQGKLLVIQGSGRAIKQQKFAQIVNKYQFVQQINEEDPLIIDALQQRIEEENLQLFGFNLKNASSRLGQTFLFMNRRGILFDLMLVNHQNIFYCELNIDDNSVGNQQQRSAQIILNYIHRNNINLSIVQNQTLVVVITDLQRISPTQSQMRVNGKNLIEIAGSSKKTTLQSYISTMFVKKPAITLTINSKTLQFKDQQVQYQNCTYEPILQHDFKTIKLRECQKQQNISIYRGGIRVGRYNKKLGVCIEGYVEISLHYQLNILRNRVENNKLIEEQLDKICEQFRQNYRKRSNQLSVHELENNVKNS